MQANAQNDAESMEQIFARVVENSYHLMQQNGVLRPEASEVEEKKRIGDQLSELFERHGFPIRGEQVPVESEQVGSNQISGNDNFG